MWILIVCENRTLLEEARRCLTGHGHHVVGAPGEAEALAHLHLRPFDFVACDAACAGQAWIASLRDRWDTFDVPLAVFSDPADLAEPLRRASLKDSRTDAENSARGWPRPSDARLASRLLSVFHATRRA